VTDRKPLHTHGPPAAAAVVEAEGEGKKGEGRDRK